MRAMVHKREVIRNMTKAILAEKGNSNTQNHILGMYVGTKYVGVSYCDPATKGVKPMGYVRICIYICISHYVIICTNLNLYIV